jgi:hypothetical protein
MFQKKLKVKKPEATIWGEGGAALYNIIKQFKDNMVEAAGGLGSASKERAVERNG